MERAYTSTVVVAIATKNKTEVASWQDDGKSSLEHAKCSIEVAAIATKRGASAVEDVVIAMCKLAISTRRSMPAFKEGAM